MNSRELRTRCLPTFLIAVSVSAFSLRADAGAHMDGTWTAVTERGHEIAFQLLDHALTSVEITWPSGDCAPASPLAYRFCANCPTVPVVSAGSFHASGKAGAIGFTLSGSFLTDASASGTLELSYETEPCAGEVETLAWTATRTAAPQVVAPVKTTVATRITWGEVKSRQPSVDQRHQLVAHRNRFSSLSAILSLSGRR